MTARREELRQIAREAAGGRMPDLAALSAADLGHLIAEFGVYQNELLAQNEELTAARRELEAAHDRYRALYEFAPAGYLTLTPAGGVLDANGGGCRVLAAARAKLLGRDLAAFVTYPDKERLAAFLRDLPLDGAPQTAELTMRTMAGERRAMHLEARRLRDGETSQVLAVLVDISERKHLEEELLDAKGRAEAANRAKSDFLARMSHEIRTPMNAVMGMTELSLMEPSLPPRVREYLEMAQQSARGLLDIINDVLDLARIEAGRVVLAERSFDPARSVRDLLAPFAVAAETKGVRLVERLDPGLPARVVGDEGRLRQVLTNLVGNALKFTDCGEVEVTVRRSGEPERSGQTRLLFAVRDDGIGIPPENLGTIFGSFSEATRSTHAKYGGTGLGLSIAKQLVELMGGRIWAESQPGRGSLFQFTAAFGVSAAGAVAAEDAVAAPPRVRTQPLRVLVAEDTPLNAHVIRAFLERMGHQVVLTGDGREALAAWERDSFDVVLLDVQMPVMDGTEAVRRLREREAGSGRHTPVVALTAHALQGDRERFLAAGMDDYLSKPIEYEELEKLLWRLAQSRGEGSTGSSKGEHQP